jgi:hypothetical protein
MDRAPRLIGAGTAAFGALMLARPSLVRALCVVDDDRAARLLGSVIGARDLVTGVAIAAAPRGRPLRSVLLGRATLDAVDGALFGRLAGSPTKRRLARAAGFGFAAVCLALAVAERDGRVS